MGNDQMTTIRKTGGSSRDRAEKKTINIDYIARILSIGSVIFIIIPYFFHKSELCNTPAATHHHHIVYIFSFFSLRPPNIVQLNTR